MKKLPLLILALILIAVFAMLFFVSRQNSDMAMKDKCSKFLETAKDRYKGGKFEGTFYSKSKQTCVSIYQYYGDTSSVFDVYDELTGQFLINLGSFKETNKLEVSLDLLK